LTDADARDRGLPVLSVTAGLGDVPGAYTRGEGIWGTGRLVIDRSRGVIVGATFTGPEVQELLHSATVAVAGEVPIDRLRHAVPSFPTLSEIMLHLLEAYEAETR
jgi:dihydrolipoamide dehydrogenase